MAKKIVISVDKSVSIFTTGRNIRSHGLKDVKKPHWRPTQLLALGLLSSAPNWL